MLFRTFFTVVLQVSTIERSYDGWATSSAIGARDAAVSPSKNDLGKID